MEAYSLYRIKSFKHDGHLHRVWMENWRIPPAELHPTHRAETMDILINSHTVIIEADAKEWISKVPSVAFFIPKAWYNIIALIEDQGVRYYCNIASPAYIQDQVITYIDYDLDVIRMPTGETHVVDREEYELHRTVYHYSETVQQKVQEGLNLLLKRIEDKSPPFHDEIVMSYYHQWKKKAGEDFQ